MTITISVSFYDVLSLILGLTANSFLILAGIFLHKEKQNWFILFLIAGVINLTISLLIFFLMPPIVVSGMIPTEIEYLKNYYIYRTLYTQLPLIGTIGIFFIILGRKRKEEYGNYLTISGIISCINVSLFILSYYLFTQSRFVEPPPPLFILSVILIGISVIIALFSTLLLFIYSLKIKASYLTIAASIFIAANFVPIFIFLLILL